ncbi:MAG: acyl-CoA dehydrogenase [Alphaproteobacteria bacterium]|nr:acyl-CoA dehydrogenase [Alphaproteobacteria bacterium]
MSLELLHAALRRFTVEHATPAVRDGAEAGAFPAALWQAAEDAGFTRPFASGGWAEAGAIVQAAGRDALPVPMAESIAASWLLEQVGIEPPPGLLTLGEGEIELARSEVTGNLWRVPWGGDASHVVAEAAGELVLIPCPNLPMVFESNLAGEPRVSLVLDRRPCTLGTDRIAPGTVRRLGAAMRALQMAGAMSAALELAVEYANTRVQFGKPIAKFQAIQQNLAAMAVEVAAASAAAEGALSAIGETGFEFWAAAAKSRCGDAAGQAAAQAHAVFGAIGFTHEHALHRLTRRLWSWRAEFGSERYWNRELGRAALARGADNLWPDLTLR